MNRKCSFWAIAIVIVMLSVSLAACGGGGGASSTPPPSLVSIAIAPLNASILRSSSQQFKATGTYSDSSAKDITSSVTWTSSVSLVAAIGTTGVAEPISAGTTTIAASIGSISASTPLVVQGINLPKTGQTTTYSASAALDDGGVRSGVSLTTQRFTLSSAGSGTVVVDNLTGLTWAPNGNIMPSRDPGWDNDATANDGLVTWQHALDYIQKLNAENYLGYSDWRFPNRKEFRSLINHEQLNNGTWLNSQGFINVQNAHYWSSSTAIYATTYAWVVNMNVGFVSPSLKTEWFYVWAVRGEAAAYSVPAEIPITGQLTSFSTATTYDDGALEKGSRWPMPRFSSGAGIENDCMIDNLTGLMWPKDGYLAAVKKAWQDALDYADSLDYCGHTDWRLPNVHELESLVHYGLVYSSDWLNTSGFSNVQPDYYWSSTTYKPATTQAWFVTMNVGYINGNSLKTVPYCVLPVRGGL